MVEPHEPIDVSIVIPCYCSESTLPELAAQLAQAFERSSLGYEILLVNDASPDGTWRAIESLASQNRSVRGLDLLFRTGQYRATLCGLERARGRSVITMDDDLQHPPEWAPALAHALDERPQCDCIMAAFPRKRQGPLRRLGGALVGRVYQSLHGKPPGLQATSFRALRRPLAQAICSHRTANPNVNALIFRTTSRIENLPVEHQPRFAGRSGYSLWRLAGLASDSVLSVSTLPLKCVSTLGFAAAAGSLLLAAYYLARYLAWGFRVAGFATQVLLIIFFGGMTLFSVGLLGEYVIRIMDEVRGSPRYLIRSQCGGQDDQRGTANPSDQ